MTVLLYTLGVLLFVFGVAASIGLHELGHLIPGKLFDVKVTQYFVGFGRTLWSRRRGETEYGVKAVPLGGYVKLIGMLPPGPDQDPTLTRSSHTGMFAQLVSDARAAEYELVEEGDENRLFYRLPWWKKVVIMISGVMTNLVIAFVLFGIVYMGHGIPTFHPTTRIGAVSTCVVAATKSDKPRACTSKDPESPAKAAGLLPGDTIVSFNGQRTTSFTALQKLIRANDAGRASIVVRRDGTLRTLTTNTTVSARPISASDQKLTKVGFLGVTPAATKAVYVRQGPGYVVTQMASGTWQTVQALGTMPNKLYHVSRAALGLEKRDANGPMSVVGAGRVAGSLASDGGVSVATRFFDLLLLLAGLNLFLGLFNLVPLPPLDGGPIATTLFEAARRGIARLRHRPDPGFVDSAKLLPVTYVMASVILVAGVVLIYADIVAPVSIS